MDWHSILGEWYNSPLFIYDILENQDRKIFDKVKHQEKHPLRNLTPKLKVIEYNLRHKSSHQLKLEPD